MQPDKPVCLSHPELTRAERSAIKSCIHGEPTADQARTAMHAVIHKLAGTHDLAFVPGAPNDSAFMSGRQFVGYRLLHYANEKIPEDKTNA